MRLLQGNIPVYRDFKFSLSRAGKAWVCSLDFGSGAARPITDGTPLGLGGRLKMKRGKHLRFA